MVLPMGLLEFRKAFEYEGVIYKNLIAKNYVLIDYTSNDKNHFLFRCKYDSDLEISLLFSFQQENICNVAILLGSRFVTQFYMKSYLPWKGIPLETDQPVTIVAVDLVWLRWNHDSTKKEVYKNDYDYSSNTGIARILFDLDSVGENFISQFKNKRSQAQMLMKLDNYAQNVEWGGGPKSVSPFIYSAILFAGAGSLDLARMALDEGLFVYATEVPRPIWEDVRLKEYQLCRRSLISHIEQQEKNDAKDESPREDEKSN